MSPALRLKIAAWGAWWADLGRCYAAILFCRSPIVGGAFLAATLSAPNTGAAGLLGALCAMWTVRGLGLAESIRAPAVYNSLLVALSLGSLYRLDGSLVALIVLGTVATVFLTQVLADRLARRQLPVLSLPFVLVAWMLWLAARSLGGTLLAPAAAAPAMLTPWLDGFFTALGWFFFLPQPLAGLLLFTGVAWTSRYLAILAVCGYALGDLTLHLFTYSPVTAPHAGFNFMLTAMAVGGIFAVPGRGTFVLAMLGTALAALFSVVLAHVLAPFYLPVFTMPFVLATLIVLATLARRERQDAGLLVLDRPNLPEATYERVRLTAARLGADGSVALAAPFAGEWQVYQGFGGRHTHRPPWQHALDFFILDGERSFRGTGLALSDYHCFGATVTAPASGLVYSGRDDLPDNPPGEVDTLHNWGNFLLIRTTAGHYVLLAHLRQGSLAVRIGDWVMVGQPVAACGSSGRSPQPHLHLQVQADPRLGGGTVPFHLNGVLTREPERPDARLYQLTARPRELTSVAPATRDVPLGQALHFPVGRSLTYRFRAPRTASAVARRLRVELTLLGQFRLVADGGASVALEESPVLLACYDRSPDPDTFLDLWLLALGLTPLSRAADCWHDTLPARVMPMNRWQRIALGLRPLGAVLDSRYQRAWDAERQCWQQTGRHRLRLLPGLAVRATTVALISPVSGCVSIRLQTACETYEATLEATGLAGDNGVPSWTETVPAPPPIAAAS